LLCFFVAGLLSANLWTILREHLFNHAITRLQSLGEFLRLGAATFGHVRFAAAATADDWRELFYYLSGRNFLGEVVGRADDERGLAIIRATQHYNPRFDSREKSVGKLTHARRIQSTRFACDNFHARDFASFVTI